MSQTIRIPLTRGFFALIDAEDCRAVCPFKWYANRSGCRPNLVYAFRRNSGVSTLMHRLIMNATPGQIVDHINGDTLDNRRENLRIVTQGQNLANSGPTKRSKTGIRGVHVNRWGDYVVQIRRPGKSRYVGTFKSLSEAEEAFAKAYYETHGLQPRAKERAQ